MFIRLTRHVERWHLGGPFLYARDLGQFWFVQVALSWHQVTPWPACGSDLANRGGPPKCHRSTQFEGRMHVSGAWQGPQQCCYSDYDFLHEWQFLKAPHDLISESYAVIIKQSWMHLNATCWKSYASLESWFSWASQVARCVKSSP